MATFPTCCRNGVFQESLACLTRIQDSCHDDKKKQQLLKSYMDVNKWRNSWGVLCSSVQREFLSSFQSVIVFSGSCLPSFQSAMVFSESYLPSFQSAIVFSESYLPSFQSAIVFSGSYLPSFQSAIVFSVSYIQLSHVYCSEWVTFLSVYDSVQCVLPSFKSRILFIVIYLYLSHWYCSAWDTFI